MPPDGSTQLATIRQQIAELDALAQQTCQDLNTVAGTERVQKWKLRTAALLTATAALAPVPVHLVAAEFQKDASFSDNDQARDLLHGRAVQGGPRGGEVAQILVQ